jgi:hypothetical protein
LKGDALVRIAVWLKMRLQDQQAPSFETSIAQTATLQTQEPA